MKCNIKLTKKEEELMRVLWDANKPLTASDICNYAETMQMDLNQSTIRMILKKLLQDGLIRVAEFTQVNRVIARAYEPVVSPDELAVLKFKHSINPSKNSGLVAALLAHIEFSDDDIQMLSEMIEELKRK